MEIKEKQQINKNAKKFKVDIPNSKDVLGNLVSFYREHIMIVHAIIFVISLILFSISFFTTFPKIKAETVAIDSSATAKGIGELLKEDLFLSFITIFAGITPFCYLSVIGLAQSVLIVDHYAMRYAVGSSFLFTSFVGGIIQIVGIALCVAVGIYYCKLTTKKNKYYHQSGFGMDDIKERLYDIRKDTKKLEELKVKREEKARKIQEANVKIPYGSMILLGVIGFLFQFVGTLIAAI